MKMTKTILAIILSLSLLPCNIILAETADNPDFDAYMEDLAQDILNDDYLTMHFTVKDKRETSTAVNPVFEPITDDYFENIRENANEVINQLEQFDYEKLSDRQKTDYKAVIHAFTDQKERGSDPYFTWLFTPSSNLITNLATYLTEFRFSGNSDYDNFVILLSSVPAYIESAVNLTKKQAEKGYFMPDVALDETLTQINEFASETDKNIIITSFTSSIKKADLTEEEKNEYISEVYNIVTNNIIPSCENVVKELSELRGKGSQTGYSDIEGGTEYFEKMTQYFSSTDNSIEEQFEDLDKFLKKALKQLASKAVSGFKPDSFPASSPESTLNYLSSAMSDFGFPQIESTDYTIEYLDGSSVAGNVMAYYVTSPVDSYNDNVIVINNDIEKDNTILYQTLAHEGFPGHLYQHVYYLRQKPLLIRSLISFPGYSEGWGMYADHEAVHWGEVPQESAQYISTERAANYALTAQIDLCVNGLGYSVDELKAYIKQLGLDGSAAQEYYNYALCYAGNYGSYGYGLIRILAMKENAEYSLGDSFDNMEFNRIILKDGPRMLDDVEADIISWVESHNVNYKEPEDNSRLIYILFVGGCTVCGCAVALILGRKKNRSNIKTDGAE